MYERVRQLEGEVQHWKSQITSSNEHLSRANALVCRLEGHVHGLGQDNEDLQAKLNRYRRLADRYAREQTELKSRLAKERERAENAESRLEASAERVAALHRELKAEQDRHTESAIRYGAARSEYENIQHGAIRDLSVELDQTRAERDRWIKRNEAIEAQLAQVRAIVK